MQAPSEIILNQLKNKAMKKEITYTPQEVREAYVGQKFNHVKHGELEIIHFDGDSFLCVPAHRAKTIEFSFRFIHHFLQILPLTEK